MPTMLEQTTLTLEEFLALPDDPTVERELINGEVRERPMTKRNAWHSSVESRLCHLLQSWLENQPEPRGVIASGEAGATLRRDPPSNVGIDVAYFGPELRPGPETIWFEGPPILAVEILSPSDTNEDIDLKLDLYLETGVKLVWIVDPHFKTITVYRSDAPPRLFNIRDQITGEPFLPGFSEPVSRIFNI